MIANSPAHPTAAFLRAVVGGDKVRLVYLPEGGQPQTKIVSPETAAKMAQGHGAKGSGALFFSPYPLLNWSAPAKESNVAPAHCVVADFDDGLPDNIHDLAPHFIVHSGGVTEDGKPKAHCYWLLSEPSDQAHAVNAAIAERWGACSCVSRATQLLRVPGSSHNKSGRKLCAIAWADPFTDGYSLEEVAELTNATPEFTEKDGGNADGEEGFQELSLLDVDSWAPPRVREVLEFGLVVNAGESTVLSSGAVSRQDFATSLIGALAAQASKLPAVASLLKAQAVALIDKHVAHDGGRWLEGEVSRLFDKLFKADATRPPEYPTGEGFQRRAVSVSDIRTAPAPRKELVAGLIPQGCLCELVAQGGVGKSTIALALAASIAGGVDFLGYGATQGRAIFFGLEDSPTETGNRLTEIDMDMEQLEDVADSGKLEVYHAADFPGGLRPFVMATGGKVEPSPRWLEVTEAFRGCGAALVVVDNALLLAHDDANKDHVARAILGALEEFRRACGEDTTLMLLHHVTKPSADGTADISANDVKGSGSWLDGVRHVLVAKLLKQSLKQNDPAISYAEQHHGTRRVISLGVAKSNVGCHSEPKLYAAHRAPEQRAWGTHYVSRFSALPEDLGQE